MKARPDWQTLVGNIKMHIRSLNFGYIMDCNKLGVTYFNEYASFVNEYTVQLKKANGETRNVTANKFVIACGGRPSYPDIPGAREFGISSDDIFSLQKAPGKTLVVGASYVALECAGYLTALGYDTTVMVRSILLRGFDQDCANIIGQHMEMYHTKFIRGATPSSLSRAEEGGPITVTYSDAEGEKTDTFDTVLFAIGRYAVTEGLNLDNAGVTKESNGKIKVNDRELTNVRNIYALGDVIHGNLELTPVAIKSGKLLADRFANKSDELMDYKNVATTVFTPIEYGTIGLTEEQAKERYGAENIDTWHTRFQPLEWAMDKEITDGRRTAYTKVLANKADSNRIVGFHMCAIQASVGGWLALGFAESARIGTIPRRWPFPDDSSLRRLSGKRGMEWVLG